MAGFLKITILIFYSCSVLKFVNSRRNKADDKNKLKYEGSVCMKKGYKVKCFGEGDYRQSSQRPPEEDEVVTPVFFDHWGYPVNWTDPGDGWDKTKRQRQTQLHVETSLQIGQVRSYTELGYKKMKIPKDLYEFILEKRVKDQLYWEWKECPNSAHMNCDQIVDGEKVLKRVTQVMLFLDEPLVRQKLENTLKPIVEEWGATEVKDETVIYGIRRYLRGAWMAMHVDKLPTHILSAILQIDQDVDEEWPLLVVDHKGRKEKIFLKSGEMLLYESAKVPHGRQIPFNGTFYDNIFIHFRTHDYML